MSSAVTPVPLIPITANLIISYDKKMWGRRGKGVSTMKHSTIIAPSIKLTCKYSKLKQREGEEDKEDEPEKKENNLLLRTAWYSSEILGIAASFLKGKQKDNEKEKEKEKERVDMVISREDVVKCIKHDFLNSYFVTGNLTLEAYEEECEFADPAGSFKGLKRFKRNCGNFGLLLLKSSMKLTKWEDYEGKGIGHWKFSCVMSFPWRPILSATGYTEYYFDSCTNKVSRHVEHWNVPKMALLKQIFRPTRWQWG